MTAPLHVDLDLLDRHVVDCDGRPVGKIDDLEFDLDGPGQPILRSLLIGPQALGLRLGGRLGSWMTGTAKRLSGRSAPVVVPLDAVQDIGVIVRLRVAASELPGTGHLEHWLGDHVIARIPGGRRASG